MAFIPLTRGIKTTVRGTLDTRPWSLGFHSVTSVGAGVTSADVDAHATAADFWAGPTLASVLGTDATITSCEARDVSVSPGYEKVIPVSIPGTGPAISAPSPMAARCVMVVPSGVLRKNGAIFFPAVPSTYIVADDLTSAAITAYNTVINALLADFTNVGPNLANIVVASYRLHGAPRIPAVGYQVSFMHMRSQVATQVRRLRRTAR